MANALAHNYQVRGVKNSLKHSHTLATIAKKQKKQGSGRVNDEEV